METTQQEIIAGLDLGSTQISVVIGKRSEDGIKIIGVGQSPCRGMRRGQIIVADTASTAIRKAIEEAELMAECTVRNVVVGIAGSFIYSQFAHAEVQVKQGKVSERDVRTAIESARTNLQLSPEREILHIIPCEFIIDKQISINQPLGMTASTLEAKVHIVTVLSTSIKNIAKACTLAGLKDLQIMLQSLATAEILLLPEEREQGVALIEIGGGPAKATIYCNGDLWHYSPTLDYCGHLTMDVAVGLRISMHQAEQVKRIHGCCLEHLVDSNFKIEVVPAKGNGTRLLPRYYVTEIIGSRMDQMLTYIAQELQKNSRKGELVSGAVITGGTSSLSGLEDLTRQVLDMPVRIGKPRTIKGVVDTVSQPHHSTAVGLVLLGARTGGVPRGIEVGKNNSLQFLALEMIRSLWWKFKKSDNAIASGRRYVGDNPLFHAITCRDEAEARRLLASGADPNERTAHGTTPLMQAVYGCSQGLIADLLAAGADPMLQDKRGYTVLVHALQRRESDTADVVQLLSGIVVDHPPDCHGYTLEDHIMMRVLRHNYAGCDIPFDEGHVALTKAAIEGNSHLLVKYLVNEFPRRILTNAMALACERGHLTCVRALVEKNADVNGLDIFGVVALGRAAGGLYPEIVKYLIEAGAKADARNEMGETPLFEACAYRALAHKSRRTREQQLADQVEIARMLLDAGSDVNVCNASGWTPIRSVVFCAENPALVRLLLERGAVPLPPEDAAGNRLSMMSMDRNREIREILGHCRTCSREHEKDPQCQKRCYR